MSIEEICDKHGVQIAYFDKELWHRHGVYIDEIKIVFVNKALSEAGHIARIRAYKPFGG